MSSYRGKHRKQSNAAKNVAKVGLAAAIVGVPTLVAAPSAGATDWDAVAQCESGGNWSTNTGNGFSGGLQFTPSTWQANGGKGSPQGASRSEQIRVAENVKKSQGMGAWPNCGSKGAGGTTNNVNSSSQSHSQSSPSQQTRSSSQSSSSQHTSRQQAPAPKSNPTPSPQPTTPIKTGNGDYKVKQGDTLGKIAKEQNVTGGWHKLYQLNNDVVKSANMIFPGQKLNTK